MNDQGYITRTQARRWAEKNAYLPPSVRYGNRRKRFAWSVKTARERLALRLAPWLHGAAFERALATEAERDIYERALVEIQLTAPIDSRAVEIAGNARMKGQGGAA